jgi:cell division septation protein DedD
MRNLVLALVLANLAFAAWHTWFAPTRRAARPEDSALPGITLVSEVPEDLRSAGVVSDTDVAPATNETAADSTPEPVTEGPLDAPVAGAAVAAPEFAAASPETSAAAEASAGATAAADTPAAAGASPELVAAATPVAAGARCTSVGPFRELSQAATAAANLRAAGYQPSQRVAEGDIWIGYWVYIEAIPTIAQANEILAKMRAEGITDSYVIPNSDSGNLVSLGVFSEISGVSKRRDQVRVLGYEPQVVDRTRRATVYWVDVVLTGEQTLDFDSLQTPGRIIRLEQRDCENGAG